MMMKTFAAAFALAAGLALSSAPMAADMTLAQMHGKMWPKSTGFATKTQCLKCHVSYEALAERTKNVSPNPHVSHQGAVNCEDCHKANLSKPVLMCNQCHNFTIRKDGKPIELAK